MEMYTFDLSIYFFIIAGYCVRILSGQTCDGEYLDLIGDNCYKYSSTPLSFSGAAAECQSWGGVVAADSDGTVKRQVQDLMDATGRSTVWYGAQEENVQVPQWKWVSECPGCTQGAPACPARTVDLAFLIDNSGSIMEDYIFNPVEENNNWPKIIQFVKDITDKFVIGPSNTQVAVTWFGNEGHVEFDLNDYSDKAGLLDAIGNMRHVGENTNTSGGLRVLRQQVFSEGRGDRVRNADNVVIVITDGQSTYDRYLTIPEANNLKREDEATIYVVGVSPNVDENEIMEMSSNPKLQNQTFWLVPQFSDLSNKKIINNILTQICGNEEDKSKHYGKYEVLSAQGCYEEWFEDRDLRNNVLMVALTPQKCMVACYERGYIYAGVRDGKECWCDNRYGTWGVAEEGCRVLCSGDTSQFCGSWSANFIYIVNNGSYGVWGENQPNDGAKQNGPDDCGALGSSNLNYLLMDDPCTDKNSYICDIPYGDCVDDESYKQKDGFCHFIGYNQLSWYDARIDCIRKGGDLALVSSDTDQVKYAGYMAELEVLTGSTRNYWVGLTQRLWMSSDGTPLRSLEFQSLYPSSLITGCAVIPAALDFYLTEQSCESPLPYYCVKNINDIDLTIETTEEVTTTSATTSTIATTTPIATTTQPTTTTVATTTTAATTTTEMTTTEATTTTAATTTTEATTTIQTTTEATTTTAATTTAQTTTTDATTTEVTTVTTQEATTNATTIILSTLFSSEDTTSPPTASPTVGASTDASSGLSGTTIFLIVLVIILIIIIALVAVGFFVYKKKQSDNQVSPGRAYDARASATIPNSEPHHMNDPSPQGSQAGLMMDPDVFYPYNEQDENAQGDAAPGTPGANYAERIEVDNGEN